MDTNVVWLDSCMENELSSNLELTTNKTGKPVMRWKGYYLQSPYDPVKEAERMVEINYRIGHLHILFGIGSGYIAKGFLEKLSEEDQLLIIEPSAALFALGDKEGCFDLLVKHPKVRILVGFEPKAIEDIIIAMVVGKYFGKIKVIESPNYNKLFLKEIKQLYELIRDASKVVLINLNTSNFFAQQWQENQLFNLMNLWKSIPLSRYFDKLTCPVIIAASGPSLNKQLDSLKKIYNNALIICAGSTINPLLKAGVRPHLIVTIDGGDNNLRHFENLKVDDIPLVHSLNVHKGIPRTHRGLQIAFNANDQHLSSWVNETYGEDLGFVSGGPSVANYCFDIARQLSSGPICFIGQDLAYTNNATHAEGNKNTQVISDDEMQSASKYIYAEGYYGDKVRTDQIFIGMRKSFEDHIFRLRKEDDSRAVVNATEGGLKITGAQNIPFNQFIKDFCQKDVSEELALLQGGVQDDQEIREHIQNSLQGEVPRLQETVKQAKKALVVLGGISRDNATVDNNALKKLDKIDLKLKEVMSNNLLHYVMLPALDSINYFFVETNDETEVERNKRILSKSETLYSAILAAATYSREVLERVLSGRENE